MDILLSLRQRLAARLEETKTPCKLYATEFAARKAGKIAAERAGKAFDGEGKPARFLVFYVPEAEKWTVALDYTEIFGRKTFQGGYVGETFGFFTY